MPRPQQSPINAALAAEIRAERGAIGLTVRQLADKSGVSYETLGLVLRNEGPISITQIQKLADAFGVPPAQLVHRATQRLERESTTPASTPRTQSSTRPPSPGH